MGITEHERALMFINVIYHRVNIINAIIVPREFFNQEIANTHTIHRLSVEGVYVHTYVCLYILEMSAISYFPRFSLKSDCMYEHM